MVESDDLRFLPSSDSEDDVLPDFNYLLKLPPSTGSRFRLKSEILKFNEHQEMQFSRHFNLDTKILNLSIQSIPFNERFEDFSWNVHEISDMKKEAKRFEEVLQEEYYKKNAKPLSYSNERFEIAECPKPVENTDEKESIQKWLDDILET